MTVSPTTSSTPRVPRDRIGRTVAIGAVGAVGLFAALLVWASQTRLEGAVMAMGQAVVRGQPKMVQSLDGGVIEDIRVTNGDRVAAGDVLVRLDPTLLQVNHDIARTRLSEALARQARLKAEEAGGAEPVFSYADLPFPRPDTRAAEADERRIFTARSEINTGRRAQLAERLAQFETQIRGMEASIASKQEQLGYLDRELGNNRTLYDQGLVRESQLLQLQRSRAEMAGAIAEAETDRARVRNSMKDAEIGVAQEERQFREQVVTDLGKTQTEIEELILQIITTSRQLDRVEVRAPAAGIVHEMQMTTLGGVVPPNGTILQVIPVEDGVEFELALDPKEIDQVHVGQKAQVVFSAFDQRATPRLAGHVTRISPTAIAAREGERSFYRLNLVLEEGEIARLKEAALVPGMPVEAFLETGEHTVMSYLLQPLASQILRAFREG